MLLSYSNLTYVIDTPVISIGLCDNVFFKQEEMERSVHVDAEDTHIRTIKVKDNSGSCKVSLWRELTKQKTPVRSHITLTNVVVQVYNDEKSVSTTPRTKLEAKSSLI